MLDVERTSRAGASDPRDSSNIIILGYQSFGILATRDHENSWGIPFHYPCLILSRALIGAGTARG